MQSELWQRLLPLLIESSTSLLQTYGVTARFGSEAGRAYIPDEGVVAFIGFTGATIRGALTISAPSEFIRKHVPGQTGPDAPEEDQLDWAGELANQLLGRLKLRLAGYGVTFELSTPTAMRGNDLRSTHHPDESAHLLTFTAEDVEFFVVFDAQVSAEFRMLETPQPEAHPVQEGDLLMFF